MTAFDCDIDRLAADDEWRRGYAFGLDGRACPLWADDDFCDGWREGVDEREYHVDHAREHRNRLARQRRAIPRPFLPRRPEIATARVAGPVLRKRISTGAAA